MRIKLFVLALSAALVWGAPDPAEGTMTGDSELECDIRTTTEGSMVRLQPLVVAGAAPASGTYSMLIRKAGLSGITQNRQGGGFSVGPGETRVLSTSTISVGFGDRFQAELTLEWSGETRSCSVEG